MKTIYIGLLGCGTVGTGVARMLTQNQDILQARVGAALKLKYVADIDIQKDRGIAFETGVLTTDAGSVVGDPQVDIVIETIGGSGIASALILEAIGNGKQVVTANKALLASQGNSLFQAAAEKGVELAFEASVGGCMPVIKTLRESLVGNRIQAMSGILNGTCNYILSKITDDGDTFEAALSEAQRRGFAEADPTLDVEGADTAHKLAILTSLAYGTHLNLKDIYVEGISRITPLDIEIAAQFGYKIKLLAISKNRGNMVEARIHPTMIPCDNLLSSVNGALNAIMITGDAVGDILLYGRGAGMMPTASAIVSDVVDIARNLLAGVVGRVPVLSYQRSHIHSIPVMPMDDIISSYYFRFEALDQPGVLSTISGILGTHGISLKSVHQKGRKSGGSVPIVMMTHLAKESNVQTALSEIYRLEVVSDIPALIRIEDANESA
jgi:homoserine dehydrogenase